MNPIRKTRRRKVIQRENDRQRLALQAAGAKKEGSQMIDSQQ
jgi:hypothetical protein